jgi:hypothetical protein
MAAQQNTTSRSHNLSETALAAQLGRVGSMSQAVLSTVIRIKEANRKLPIAA